MAGKIKKWKHFFSLSTIKGKNLKVKNLKENHQYQIPFYFWTKIISLLVSLEYFIKTAKCIEIKTPN